MEKSLTIYHLYPDLMDVYADRGNVAVLQKRCAWRGIETQVRSLTCGEMPDFDFTHPDRLNAEKQVTVKAYRSKYNTSWHNARTGQWRNYKFNIIEC